MARRKSYFAKSNRNNPAGVFLNNVIADSNRRQKEREKAEKAEQKRLSKEEERAKIRQLREAEREEARQLREAERAQKRKEEEEYRQLKHQEKLDQKAIAITERLKIEFEKIGLFPGPKIITELSKKAVVAEITAAKVKTYLIDGKEKLLAKSCAIEFLETQNISSDFQYMPQYNKLVEIITQSHPQQEVENEPKYKSLKSEIYFQINELMSAEVRELERESLINQLLETKVMFKDELEEFAYIIEQNDWGEEKAVNSVHYDERINSKAIYVLEVQSRIQPIKM